jgi:hypothetical protein
VGYGWGMTALVRLRLSGRALSSLGLLMAAVLIGIGGPGRSFHDPGEPAPGAVVIGGAVLDPAAAAQPPSEHVLTPSTVDPSTSAPSRGGADAALLPHHIRLLGGAVLMTGLATASEPFWLLILGLGLYLSGAADRNRLRRLFGGCRHSTRAPPLRF